MIGSRLAGPSGLKRTFGALGAIYRDVSGSGGYTYRQYSDGEIKILSGPRGAGTTLAVDPNSAAWMAITNEIGTPPGNTSLAATFEVWKDQFGVTQVTGTAASSTVSSVSGGSVTDVGEAAERGTKLLGILNAIASIFSSGASIASSVTSAKSSSSSTDYVSTADYSVPSTSTASRGWLIGGGALLLGLTLLGLALFAGKRKSRSRPKRLAA